MSEARVTAIATGAGIVGSLAVALTSLGAALTYVGTAGEPYSLLNHWVSELGEVGVSELATLFNAGLVVGGVCFAVFMLGLAAVRTGFLRYLFGAIGVAAGAAGALVGVFPMNELVAHSVAALAFFDLGLIAVGLASIDLVRHRDPRFPIWLAAVGAATAVVFVAFIVSLQSPAATDEALAPPEARPDVWIVAVLEWLTIASILGWTLLASIAWRRAAGTSAAGRQAASGETVAA